jgi:hypothetical protein
MISDRRPELKQVREILTLQILCDCRRNEACDQNGPAQTPIPNRRDKMFNVSRRIISIAPVLSLFLCAIAVVGTWTNFKIRLNRGEISSSGGRLDVYSDRVFDGFPVFEAAWWELAVMSAFISLLLLLVWALSRRFEGVLRVASGQCSHCGYSLVGNASGICPQRGTATLQSE